MNFILRGGSSHEKLELFCKIWLNKYDSRAIIELREATIKKPCKDSLILDQLINAAAVQLPEKKPQPSEHLFQ